MSKRSIAGCLVLASGAAVAAFPWMKALHDENGKRALLRQWAVQAEAASAAQAFPGGAAALPAGDGLQNVMTKVSGDIFEPYENEPSTETIRDMAGVIYIEKINLKSPVLPTVTDRNLNLGICVVEGSPEMGGEGNYCLAGHRGRVYGRHFNRLGELTPGDTVTLENERELFTFSVSDVFLVTAKDNWVMADTPGQTELTLITCDYSTEETGRLIVRCVIAGNENR